MRDLAVIEPPRSIPGAHVGERGITLAAATAGRKRGRSALVLVRDLLEAGEDECRHDHEGGGDEADDEVLPGPVDDDQDRERAEGVKH
jgi:hypothetical protein